MSDKNAIGWRRRNIAIPERNVCDMEIEIVTFVVKESVQLTVAPDGMKRSKYEAEALLSFMSLSRAHLMSKQYCESMNPH